MEGRLHGGWTIEMFLLAATNFITSPRLGSCWSLFIVFVTYYCMTGFLSPLLCYFRLLYSILCVFVFPLCSIFCPLHRSRWRGWRGRRERNPMLLLAKRASIFCLFLWEFSGQPRAQSTTNKIKICYSTYKIQKRGPQHSTTTHVSQKIDREVIENKDANEGHLVAASRRAIKPMVGSSSTHFPLHTSPVLSFQLSDWLSERVI